MSGSLSTALGYSGVLNQLNALPDTFLRPGATFAMIQAAKAAALFHYTDSSSGLMAQTDFSTAQGVWLDVWGKLFGIPRNNGESDTSYVNRIRTTLSSGRTTPVAIALYMLLIFNLNALITEDLVHCAWAFGLSRPLSQSALNALVQNLVYVRPCGVPVTLGASGAGGGMYLGTVNYLGAARVTGAYLESPSAQGNVEVLSAYTNNSVPLLPTTFLSDPTLNPGLA